MTEIRWRNLEASDLRRAASLLAQTASGDAAGTKAVLAEARDLQRTERTLLALCCIIIDHLGQGQLRTEDGLAALRQYVAHLAQHEMEEP